MLQEESVRNRLKDLLQQKKKIGYVLDQHREYLEQLQQIEPMRVDTEQLLQLAKNISFTLSAPPNYKDGIQLTRYFHPPAPQPIEMRQGRVYESSIPIIEVPASISIESKYDDIDGERSKNELLKRKNESPINLIKKQTAAEKAIPKIDLNFGLDDSDDEN